jgi:hypothetical protein
MFLGQNVTSLQFEQDCLIDDKISPESANRLTPRNN